jgi:hypothetical protein
MWLLISLTEYVGLGREEERKKERGKMEIEWKKESIFCYLICCVREFSSIESRVAFWLANFTSPPLVI